MAKQGGCFAIKSSGSPLSSDAENLYMGIWGPTGFDDFLFDFSDSHAPNIHTRAHAELDNQLIVDEEPLPPNSTNRMSTGIASWMPGGDYSFVAVTAADGSFAGSLQFFGDSAISLLETTSGDSAFLDRDAQFHGAANLSAEAPVAPPHGVYGGAMLDDSVQHSISSSFYGTFRTDGTALLDYSGPQGTPLPSYYPINFTDAPPGSYTFTALTRAEAAVNGVGTLLLGADVS